MARNRPPSLMRRRFCCNFATTENADSAKPDFSTGPVSSSTALPRNLPDLTPLFPLLLRAARFSLSKLVTRGPERLFSLLNWSIGGALRLRHPAMRSCSGLSHRPLRHGATIPVSVWGSQRVESSMRIVTVIGVTALGLGLGTLAVLAPLTTHSAAPPTAWRLDWGGPRLHQLASAASWLGGSKSPAGDPAASVPGPATASAPGSATGAALGPRPVPSLGPPETATLQYLTRPPVEAKPADARVAEAPWSAHVIVATEAQPRKLTSSKPATDDQRRELVRDIQRELKRVGCYDQSADGQWNSSTKRAMNDFTDRVNASLPFEEPDLILLTLVKGQRGMVCGKDCPPGQGLNDSGRCIPNGLMARAEHPRPAEHAKAKRTGDPAAARKPVTARPTQEIADSWNTTTVRTPTETGSIAQLAPPALTPPVATPLRTPARSPESVVAASAPSVIVRSSTDLPGRMSMGGPAAATQVPVAAPVAVVHSKPEQRSAAAQIQPDDQQATASVTETEPAASEPAIGPKTHREKHDPPRPHPAASPPSVNSLPRRASPVTVTVHRPSPRPYAPPVSSEVGNLSKSKRLVYEMFQRPDRN